MTTNQPEIKPVLLYKDAAAIENTQKKIANTLPLMQDILSAYNRVDGISPLTDVEFHNIFQDVTPLIDKVKSDYYCANWAEKHENIGIDFETGIELVEKTLPNMNSFLNAVDAYYQEMRSPTGAFNYVGDDFFSVIDNAIKINKARVDSDTASNSIYLEYNEEIEIKKSIDAFIKAFDKIRKLTPPEVLKIEGNPNAGVSFNELNNLFTTKHDNKNGQWSGDYLIELKVDFFRKLKAALKYRKGL